MCTERRLFLGLQWPRDGISGEPPARYIFRILAEVFRIRVHFMRIRIRIQ
jgi:hypothetical protein